jgi:hypothetical protein
MATQLRAVPTYSPTLSEIITGLDEMQIAMSALLPEAESIDFSFTAARGLMVEIKCNQREKRDAILFKIKSGIMSAVTFDKIVEGVETGARRRLTVTAEVR